MLVHRLSLKDNIKDIKEKLIGECLTQRRFEENSGNFKLDTIYLNKLYDLFISSAKKCLNKFTLNDNNFEIWCCITDKKFNITDWHNHRYTSTVNAVLYLDTQDKGIDFRYDNNEVYIKPNNDDMLIFPGALDHRLHPSVDKERISLNLEIRCKENENKLFKI